MQRNLYIATMITAALLLAAQPGNSAVSQNTAAQSASRYAVSAAADQTRIRDTAAETRSAAAAGETTSHKGSDRILSTGVLQVSAAASSTISIRFHANGGNGTMETVSAAAGASVTLPANTYTRKGYVFTGWATSPKAPESEIDDQATVTDDESMNLYATWEPQMYIIHFDGNDATYGSMNDIYGIYNAWEQLPQNMFTKDRVRFAGWEGPQGRIFTNKATIQNLDVGNTTSTKLITVDAGKPKNKKYTFRSTQGSVVFTENGVQYLVTAAGINDGAYNKGNLDHYETVLTKYNLETGEAVARARNLKFDHGNGICYNPDNGHLYIAEGGTCKGYPSGVLEVDEHLKKVKQWDFPLLTHVWGIAYADHHFYLIGKNDDSRNSLCVLNEDMDTLSITPVDDYYSQHFSSQGIAADENFLYAVSACFGAYEWKSKQRINVFDHDGNYIGVWTIDIPYEAEDITVIDGYAYINTNENAKSTIYRTKLPSVTLKAMWKS